MTPMQPTMPAEPDPIIDDSKGWMVVAFVIGGERKELRIDPLQEDEDIRKRWTQFKNAPEMYTPCVQMHLRDKHELAVSQTAAIGYQSAITKGIERAKSFFDPWRSLQIPIDSTPAPSATPNAAGLWHAPPNSAPPSPCGESETNAKTTSSGGDNSSSS